MNMRFTGILLLACTVSSVALAEDIIVQDIREFYAKADVERGRIQTQPCTQCHTFEKGAAAERAPNLWGIWNRHKASTPGFNYSKALLAKRNEFWTFDDLNAYLYNPGALIPGTSHPFLGLRDHQMRANIIAYLGTLEPQPDPQQLLEQQQLQQQQLKKKK